MDNTSYYDATGECTEVTLNMKLGYFSNKELATMFSYLYKQGRKTSIDENGETERGESGISSKVWNCADI